MAQSGDDTGSSMEQSVPSAPVASSMESYRSSISSMPSTLSQDLLHPMAHLCTLEDLAVFPAGPAGSNASSSTAGEAGAASSNLETNRKRERQSWADISDSPPVTSGASASADEEAS